MRNFNETTVTNAALERKSGASDARVRQISEAVPRFGTRGDYECEKSRPISTLSYATALS
jgi:hypothetical protein